MLASNTSSAPTSDHNLTYRLDHSWCWCVGPVSPRPPPVTVFPSRPNRSHPAWPTPHLHKSPVKGTSPTPTPQRQQKRGEAQNPGGHQPTQPQHPTGTTGTAGGQREGDPPAPPSPPVTPRGQDTHLSPKGQREGHTKPTGRGPEPHPTGPPAVGVTTSYGDPVERNTMVGQMSKHSRGRSAPVCARHSSYATANHLNISI